MNKTFEFTLIPDVEVLPVRFDIRQNCVGTNKTGADIMLEVTHCHSSDPAQGSTNVGKVYLFFSYEQAVDLINQLDNTLHRNKYGR